MTTRLLAVIVACVCAGGVGAKDRPPPPKRDDARIPTGCESVGKDYRKLPGSDTCVKVSGSSRMEGATILGR